MQAFRGEAEARGKLELANDARASHRAVKLGDDQGGRTTGTGLRDQGHLGYSNGGSLANILVFMKLSLSVTCKALRVN